MRRVLGYKPKVLRCELYKWCEKNICGYKKELYYKIINNAIKQACKKESILVDVPGIKFYKYEIDYIDGILIKSNDINAKDIESAFSYDCKKLLFTILFIMKANKYIAEAKNTGKNFEYNGRYFKGGQRKYSELKKLAKLSNKVRINEDIFNTLWINGLVTPMFNGLVKLDFIEDINRMSKDPDVDKSIVIEITDFDSVGYYYDYIHQNKKVSFCKHCGKIFKRKSNRQEYCSNDCSMIANRYKTKERMRSIRNSNCLI